MTERRKSRRWSRRILLIFGWSRFIAYVAFVAPTASMRLQTISLGYISLWTTLSLGCISLWTTLSLGYISLWTTLSLVYIGISTANTLSRLHKFMDNPDVPFYSTNHPLPADTLAPFTLLSYFPFSPPSFFPSFPLSPFLLFTPSGLPFPALP
jgi:hypothetical protein